MNPQFRNRKEAGQILATKLSDYAGRTDVIVLALPRGGVPVGYEVARSLNAPLDVFVVRKLGVPGQEELAMGAIATGGVTVLNAEVIDAAQIPGEIIEQVAEQEWKELERREWTYRGERPPLEIEQRTVILVDDGIATGSTMRAAVKAVRQRNAALIIVAVPVAALRTESDFRFDVDAFVSVITPSNFRGVGEWYKDFSQTTDAEVSELLAQANRSLRAA